MMGWSQYHHLAKNHLNDPELPDWAVMMYGNEPNVHQVKSLYENYYATHEFEKNEHTQYYKRWINAVKSSVNEEGRILNHVPLSTANRGGGFIWNYCGPEVHLAADGSETEISEQANVYCHDRSASNPQILYCGTESGGLYKSLDDGAHWTHVTSLYPIGAVSAVKIHPMNPDIVIFSAQNDLWKTTDGGVTWNVIGQSNFVSQNVSAWEIIFHPSDVNVVMVATNVGLFKSTDQGSSWTEISTQ